MKMSERRVKFIARCGLWIDAGNGQQFFLPGAFHFKKMDILEEIRGLKLPIPNFRLPKFLKKMDNTNPPTDPELRRLDQLATLLDNQFRVPGTDFRFGLDAIVGLIPYVGDLSGFLVSGLLIRTMAKKGAGVGIIFKMMGNVLLDAAVGLVPLLGDFFDFGFKANRRNVDLLKNYYATGEPRPDAKWSLAIISILLFGLLCGMFWLTFMGAKWVWGAIAGLF